MPFGNVCREEDELLLIVNFDPSLCLDDIFFMSLVVEMGWLLNLRILLDERG